MPNLRRVKCFCYCLEDLSKDEWITQVFILHLHLKLLIKFSFLAKIVKWLANLAILMLEVQMDRWQKPDSNQSVSINEQNAHLTHKNNTLVQVVDSVVLVHMINLELNIKCGHSITAAAIIICVRYLAAKTISIFVFISSYLLIFFACMDVMNPNIWSCTLSQFF